MNVTEYSRWAVMEPSSSAVSVREYTPWLGSVTLIAKLPLLFAVSVKVCPPTVPRENSIAVTLAFLAVVPLMVKVASLVSAGGALVSDSLIGRAGMGSTSVNSQVFITFSSSVLSAALGVRPRICISSVMV